MWEERVYFWEIKTERQRRLGNGLHLYTIFSESPQSMKPLSHKSVHWSSLESTNFFLHICVSHVSHQLITSPIIPPSHATPSHPSIKRSPFTTLSYLSPPSSPRRFTGVAAGQWARPQWAGLPQEADARGAVLATADRGIGPPLWQTATLSNPIQLWPLCEPWLWQGKGEASCRLWADASLRE